MSVYLSDGDVLLNDNDVAINSVCCCSLPLCACGYDAFDGSGRKFLTRTFNVVVHWDRELFGGAHIITDFSAHRVSNIDPDTCVETTNCTYTSSCTVTDGCSCSLSGDCDAGWPGCPDCLDCSPYHWENGIECGGSPAHWDCISSHDATHYEDDGTYNVPPDLATATQTIDLSNECIPV